GREEQQGHSGVDKWEESFRERRCFSEQRHGVAGDDGRVQTCGFVRERGNAPAEIAEFTRDRLTRSNVDSGDRRDAVDVGADPMEVADYRPDRQLDTDRYGDDRAPSGRRRHAFPLPAGRWREGDVEDQRAGLRYGDRRALARTRRLADLETGRRQLNPDIDARKRAQ